MKSINLYPQPQFFKWLDGKKTLTSNLSFRMAEEAKRNAEKTQLKLRLNKAFLNDEQKKSVTNVYVNKRDDLHSQGYILQWDEDGLLMEFSADEGLHYAIVTLEQLALREGLEWNFFRIEDEPDFPVRGFMLDIGRNKIPKMETLYTLIDRLSELKMNHFQLYMEGYSYEYKKYSHLFPDSTPITAEEFQQLDKYAKDRFIDLVPNQNCFGHMGEWLNKPELQDLAEHPDGIPTPYQFSLPPVTLNPIDQRSIQLVEDLFDELLPNFSSSYVNINMDEPFGLGDGKSKRRAEKIGVGELYFEYAQKIFDIVRRYNKHVLIWGDVLIKHPDIIHKLPEDVTVLEWNYDDHISFENNCRLLHQSKTPFYVCPGTSSWQSISGRTENMLKNISDAAINGRTYGAKGLIVTDWGDSGHWQVPAISYPGMIYAAGLSWQVQNNLNKEIEVENYATEVVFKDKNGEIGNLLMELGRYYLLENSTVENATYTNHLLNQGLCTREELEKRLDLMMKISVELGGTSDSFQLNYDDEAMRKWLDNRKKQLSKINLDIPDKNTVKEELENTLRLIEQGIWLHHYVYQIGIKDQNDEIKLLKKLESQLQKVITEFNRLWLIRNRESGLEKSNQPLYKLLKQYQEKLVQLQDEN